VPQKVIITVRLPYLIKSVEGHIATFVERHQQEVKVINFIGVCFSVYHLFVQELALPTLSTPGLQRGQAPPSILK
jgi:hypothetical protein